MWVQSLGQEDALEKEMAIHSSILPWKIPWTEESGRLQSMGSQTVRYDWVVMEARSNAVKSNIGYEPGMLGPWIKANWKWSNRIWQEWMSTFTLEKGDGEGNGKPLQYSCLENTMNSMKRQKDRTLKVNSPGQWVPNMLLDIRNQGTKMDWNGWI